MAETEQVRAEIAAARARLDAAGNALAAGGEDAAEEYAAALDAHQAAAKKLPWAIAADIVDPPS